MGHLVLARHASTDASQVGRNLGQRGDPPLSAHGLELADRLGVAVANELGVLSTTELRLITSPALRCMQTAAGISDHLGGAPSAEVAAGLIEINYGDWEGLTPEECAQRDPAARAAWEADPFATATPGGESGADVTARAFPVFESIEGWLSAEPARAAIVVAHNHVNRLWLTDQMGWPMTDYRRRVAQDPAGYSLVSFAAGPPLVRRINAVPLLR
ncbi:MAG: histidine phosphatase family protein [Chloroflexota bacterium]|nr:histidine phosphatase family protein [Chloroflexota bacterium]